MFKNLKKQKNNGEKAFTLIESLVAISILMIAIASPMVLAQKSLLSATASKDQMIATFLAQDAIEAVKNIRDQIARNNTNPSADWLTGTITNPGLLAPCVCNLNGNYCNFDSPGNLKYCTIDTTLPAWNSGSISLGNSQVPPIKISYSSNNNPSFLKYDYTGANNGGNSIFTRYINIIENPANDNPNEAVVNVRVSWNSSQGVQHIDLQNFIYNYSENFQ